MPVVLVRELAITAAIAASAVALPIAARAEPRFDASAFVGVDWFGARNALGNSYAPEQVPGTSIVVGARLGWLALPGLTEHLQLAPQAELGLSPALSRRSAAPRRAR